MEWTFKWYQNFIEHIKKNGYKVCGFAEEHNEKTCILRHDIDLNLKKAEILSSLENEMHCKSTYCVLLSTNFYNIFEIENRNLINNIMDNGCEIALHFDEMQYVSELENLNNEQYIEKIKKYISYEKDILENVIGKKVNVVSMHRPSERIISLNIKFDNLINTYSSDFFNKYKYISDSRHNWREDPDKIINEGYDKLQVLTHPLMYHENDLNFKDCLLNFCHEAKFDRYENLKKNIKKLDEILKKDDI